MIPDMGRGSVFGQNTDGHLVNDGLTLTLATRKLESSIIDLTSSKLSFGDLSTSTMHIYQ